MNIRTYEKEKVEVTCTTCKDKFKLRRDVARPSYRTHRNLGALRCTPCTTKWMSSRNKTWKGKKNPNWKGGKTSEIQKFYCSPEWKALRTKVFIRDDYTCRDCPQRGGQLEANHIRARSRFPELALDINNIETLCKKCHDKKKWMVYAP